MSYTRPNCMFRGYNEHSTIAYTINAVLTLTVYALTSRQPKRSWRGQTLADGVPAFCQKRAPRPLYVQHGLRPRTSREGAHDISVPPRHRLWISPAQLNK